MDKQRIEELRQIINSGEIPLENPCAKLDECLDEIERLRGCAVLVEEFVKLPAIVKPKQCPDAPTDYLATCEAAIAAENGWREGWRTGWRFAQLLLKETLGVKE